MRATRVLLWPWCCLAPAASAEQPTVCVRHTARRTLRGVQLVRQGLKAGCGREGSPHATRRGRRWATACAAPCACVRRAGRGRALEPKRCASSQRNRKFAGGGLPADEKRNWSSRAKPTIPSRGASTQRRARSGSEDRRPGWVGARGRAVAGGTWVGAASGARVQGVWVDPLREGERRPWTGGEILADMCELSKVSRWILLEKERGDLGQWGGGSAAAYG